MCWQQGTGSRECQGDAKEGDAKKVRQGSNAVRGHKPTGKRTDETAEAIASVKRIEDRSAVLSFDRYPLRIHRNIHRSVAGTKEHKCRDEGRKGWCEREQG